MARARKPAKLHPRFDQAAYLASTGLRASDVQAVGGGLEIPRGVRPPSGVDDVAWDQHDVPPNFDGARYAARVGLSADPLAFEFFVRNGQLHVPPGTPAPDAELDAAGG